MSKGPLVALAILGAAALGGAHCYGGYQALDACTELENRMPEAGRPTSSLESATEESIAQAIARIAGELRVQVDSTNISLEELTKENAGSVSTVAAQAVELAGKLRGHEIKGKILQLEVRAHARRLTATRRCDFSRRILLPGQ